MTNFIIDDLLEKRADNRRAELAQRKAERASAKAEKMASKLTGQISDAPEKLRRTADEAREREKKLTRAYELTREATSGAYPAGVRP